MHEHYFYVPQDKYNGAEVKIEGQEYRHCCRALRKTVGAEVIVFNGNGTQRKVEIFEEGHDCAYAKVIQEMEPERRTQPQISLGFGIVRNKAIKRLVQPATVMEVEKISPIKMKNCIKYNFKEDKIKRYAIQAAKQSGSSYLPEFSDTVGVSEWIQNTAGQDLKLIPVQNSRQSLLEVLKQYKDLDELSIMLGPEGGFSQDEVEIAKENDYIPVSLFPNRLRTELAATNILSGIYHYYYEKW